MLYYTSHKRCISFHKASIETRELVFVDCSIYSRQALGRSADQMGRSRKRKPSPPRVMYYSRPVPVPDASTPSVSKATHFSSTGTTSRRSGIRTTFFTAPSSPKKQRKSCDPTIEDDYLDILDDTPRPVVDLAAESLDPSYLEYVAETDSPPSKKERGPSVSINIRPEVSIN
jgi:hypothetical protein